MPDQSKSKWLQVADARAEDLPKWSGGPQLPPKAGEASGNAREFGAGSAEVAGHAARGRRYSKGQDSEAALLAVFGRAHGEGVAGEAVINAGRGKKLVLVALFAVWLAGGVALFTSMGFGPIEVLYIMVQIVTTVGYGDLLAETQMQKLACTAIVLTSTFLVANLIMLFIDFLLDSQTALLSERMSQKEEEIKRDIEHKARRESGESTRSMSVIQRTDKQEESSKLAELGVHCSTFLFFVLVGTAFFALLEPCSCSYGRTKLEGCVQSRCAETGGDIKTWVDSLYMSVVTLTTVGFGDSTPKTPLGRGFAAIWMLLGVGATINFIGSFSDTFLKSDNQESRDSMTRNMFHEHDADGDGYLSRTEFLKLILFQNGLVTADQFDSIMRQFDVIAGHDERISMSEFAAYYLPEEKADHGPEGDQ